MTGIYKISSPSGKVYIGQSIDIKYRWKSHKCPSGKSRLINSFKKYGINAHEFKVIHELPKDVTSNILTIYEQLYMDAYRDCGVELLNLREAGSCGTFPQEVRDKIGAAGRGRKISEANKALISALHKGHKYNLGRKLTTETKNKIRLASQGRIQSEEWKRKNSESKKGEKCYMYGIDPGKHPQAKKVKHILTGNVFSTVKEAAKYLGMKRTTLSMQLINQNRNKSGMAYDS